MRYFIALLICTIAPCCAYSQNLQFAFSNGYVGTASVNCEVGDVDITGAILIGGHGGGAVDFDPSAGASGPLSGMYITRYHTDGTFHWMICLGLINNETPVPVSLCTDKDGNIFVSGYFYGMADLDPSAGTDTIIDPNLSGEILFVASYDSLGNYRWGFTVPSTNTKSRANAIEADSIGNIYVGGYIDGGNQALDFDPDTGVTTIQSEAYEQFFLASYTNSGNFRWIVRARNVNSSHSFGSALAVQSNGTCYFGGKFNGSCDFDPSNSNTILTTNASGARTQPFIARYDSSGNFVDAFTMPCISTTTYDVIVDDICLSPDQRKFAIAGALAGGQYDFDPNGTHLVAASGSFSGFIASYDTSITLNAAWGVRDTVGNSYLYNRGVAFDSSGDIVYTGEAYSGAYDFDPGPAVVSLPLVMPCIGFISRHDSAGNFIQCFGFDYGEPYDLTIDTATNSITVTGEFDASGTTDMDPGPAQYILSPSGYQCMCVARYNTTPWIITGSPLQEEVCFNAFPIPANNMLSISFSDEAERTVEIIDASGRIALSRMINGNAATIDITALAPGAYILRVTGEGLPVSRRIIIE